MIGIEGTIALNGSRGRATPQCVWSIHRIDSQLGRLLDINSAWRNPQEQEKLYSAYRAYVNGNGPWAPIALPPEQSVHCNGEAIDTDDNNAAMTRILNDNGWFHTVFRNGQLVEPWHYEYDYKRDKFFGGSPAGSEETDMPLSDDDVRRVALAVWSTMLQNPVNGQNTMAGDILRYNEQSDIQRRDEINNTIRREVLPEVAKVPGSVWNVALNHTVSKDAQGNPQKVTTGDLLRYEPAEHKNTRDAISQLPKA